MSALLRVTNACKQKLHVIRWCTKCTCVCCVIFCCRYIRVFIVNCNDAKRCSCHTRLSEEMRVYSCAFKYVCQYICLHIYIHATCMVATAECAGDDRDVQPIVGTPVKKTIDPIVRARTLTASPRPMRSNHAPLCAVEPTLLALVRRRG